MKKFIVCIMVFLMMLCFSSNSVHAKTPNRLQMISAVAYISDPGNATIEIYALNFGDDPQVKLGDIILEKENITFEDQTISADFPEGIIPGIYRLSVARKGFDFSHPEKADSLDVTISDANTDPESRDFEEPSGALKRENIYEIQQTSFITVTGDTTISCSCDDENDIALNGGYEITPNLSGSNLELITLKSNIDYSEIGNDSYQLSFYNPIGFNRGEYIRIDAYLRCITIPGPDN